MDSYTCDSCGGEIIFRVVGGVTTPIHLSGGCWGTGDDEASPTRLQYDENYCHRTICPRCGASVYFIRHNGGSVWVDELGWPWPKHPCFDDAEPYRRLCDAAKTLRAPAGGVITQVVFPPDRRYCEVTITTPQRNRYSWLIRGVENLESLSGALVVFSTAEHSLVDAAGRRFPIAEVARCSVCDQLVELQRIDAHMAESHRIERCRICKKYVSRGALQEHLRTHPRHKRRR